jgi:hypothetical protein
VIPGDAAGESGSFGSATGPPLIKGASGLSIPLIAAGMSSLAGRMGDSFGLFGPKY